MATGTRRIKSTNLLPERGHARMERYARVNHDEFREEEFALNKRTRRIDRGIPTTDRFGKVLNK